MAKYVIDIPENWQEQLNEHKLIFADIIDINTLKNATPLEKVLDARCSQAFYDGYKKATEQANSVIKDIKADINEISEEEYGENSYWSKGLRYSLKIIDEHISGR